MLRNALKDRAHRVATARFADADQAHGDRRLAAMTKALDETERNKLDQEMMPRVSRYMSPEEIRQRKTQQESQRALHRIIVDELRRNGALQQTIADTRERATEYRHRMSQGAADARTMAENASRQALDRTIRQSAEAIQRRMGASDTNLQRLEDILVDELRRAARIPPPPTEAPAAAAPQTGRKPAYVTPAYHRRAVDEDDEEEAAAAAPRRGRQRLDPERGPLPRMGRLTPASFPSVLAPQPAKATTEEALLPGAVVDVEVDDGDIHPDAVGMSQAELEALAGRRAQKTGFAELVRQFGQTEAATKYDRWMKIEVKKRPPIESLYRH